MEKEIARYNGCISKDIMDIFKEQARKEDRTVTNMINRLIKNYCNEIESSK